MHVNNGSKLNTAWTIADLVNTSELDSKWMKATDYSMALRAGDPDVAILTWKPSHPDLRDPRWVVMEITNVASGAATMQSVDPPKH